MSIRFLCLEPFIEASESLTVAITAAKVSTSFYCGCLPFEARAATRAGDATAALTVSQIFRTAAAPGCVGRGACKVE